MSLVKLNIARGVTGTLPTSNYVQGGITEADQWRLTTSFNGTANPIASNWERNDTTFDKIGTGMSESSGIFTFPSTGIYKVEFNINASKSSGDTMYNASKIFITTNNSDYNERALGYSFINEAGGETYSSSHCQLMIDVTDTSNIKVRFGVINQAATDFYGDTNVNKTTATFIRLGST